MPDSQDRKMEKWRKKKGRKEAEVEEDFDDLFLGYVVT